MCTWHTPLLQIHEQPLMSDSQDLRSVISENLKDDTHVTNQPAEPSESATTPPTKETPDVQPQSEQPEAQEEGFAKKIDAKGMTPEQLDSIYSNYQKAYTQRRQKEKEEIRRYQEQIKKYEEQLKNPQLNQNPAQRQVQQQFDLGNLSFEQYTNAMRQASQQDARQIAEEVWTQREDKSNQEQMLQRFNSLDERFDKKFTDAESPEYNATNAWLYQNVAMELASALDAHIQANGTSIGFDSDTIAKEAIKRFDGLIDSIVASKVKESTQQAQNKATEISRSNPKGKVAQSNTIGSRNLRDLISANLGD